MYEVISFYISINTILEKRSTRITLCFVGLMIFRWISSALNPCSVELCSPCVHWTMSICSLNHTTSCSMKYTILPYVHWTILPAVVWSIPSRFFSHCLLGQHFTHNLFSISFFDFLLLHRVISGLHLVSEPLKSRWILSVLTVFCYEHNQVWS